MSRGPSPLVLFRTAFFGSNPLKDVAERDQRDHLTIDQGRLQDADVVVFHIPDVKLVEIGDTPKYPGQLWVAWSMECKINYPLLSDPFFLALFNLFMTYERNSDVWVPFLPDLVAWQRAVQSEIPCKTAPSPVVMFLSSAQNKSGRCALAAELMQHIKIDSYGHYLRNKRLAGGDFGRRTKLETIADYYFCLALENAIAHDYVTEQLYDCLLTGVVPVYLGAPNVAEFAPAGSYIGAETYGGPSGLAAYLHCLLERPDEYASYFAWRDKPLPADLIAMLQSTATDAFARLLKIAATRAEQQELSAERLSAFHFAMRAYIRSKSSRSGAVKPSEVLTG